MIKIPKNLDELKQMVSNVPVDSVLDKVKETFKAGVGAVEAKAESVTTPTTINTDELLADFMRLKELHKEQQVCLNEIERFVEQSHNHIIELEAKIEQLMQAAAASKDAPKQEDTTQPKDDIDKA